jgi:hypothetical protein
MKNSDIVREHLCTCLIREKRKFIIALNRKHKIDEVKYIEGLADRGKYLNVALYSGLKDQKAMFSQW